MRLYESLKKSTNHLPWVIFSLQNVLNSIKMLVVIEMKKEEIRVLVLVKIADKLKMNLEDVNAALLGNEKTQLVINALESEYKRYSKLANDFTSMATKSVYATPIMVEYSKNRKYLETTRDLIRDSKLNLIKVKKGR